jgi:UDP-2,3-diacylglucosamine pyrophosphatase LpxH
VFAGCGKNLEYKYVNKTEFLTKPAAAFPEVRFITMSDLHYYDKSLGVSGQAYSNYLLNDRKLLTLSESLIQAAVEKIIQSSARFVIISGDLTKDGEKLCHEKVSAYLSKIEASGKSVYVVPGNHDINNPHAVSYNGTNITKVDTINAEEFAQIYFLYGYQEAFARDTNSLSYAVEPVSGLWLLCIDSTDHKDNFKLGEPVTAGKLTQPSLDWIETILHDAVIKNKAVIAVMHHGAVPHWKGQEKLHPEYIIDEYPGISQMLAAYHVRAVFTGHYHANDITLKSFANKSFLFDIETGSLVTYPSPMRIVDIGANQKMTVSTMNITSIPAYNGDLAAYAKAYVIEGLSSMIYDKLIKYGVTAGEAQQITPYVAEGFVMHYAGEDTNKTYEAKIDGLGIWGSIVFDNQKYVIENLRVDLEPPDNDVVLDLREGAWSGAK